MGRCLSKSSSSFRLGIFLINVWQVAASIMYDINQKAAREECTLLSVLNFCFLVCTYIGSRCQARACPLSSVYQKFCRMHSRAVLQIERVFLAFLSFVHQTPCHMMAKARSLICCQISPLTAISANISPHPHRKASQKCKFFCRYAKHKNSTF